MIIMRRCQQFISSRKLLASYPQSSQRLCVNQLNPLNTIHTSLYNYDDHKRNYASTENVLKSVEISSKPNNETMHPLLSNMPPEQNVTFATKLVNNSSPKIRPYLKLLRIDKPIGSWLLFWPCSWSIALAAPPGALPDLQLLTLFGIGAFIMRGAGCIINDIWDQDIDGMVARTKDRPLVTGEISPLQSLVFLGSQLTLGLLVLLHLNLYSIILGASSMVLVMLYPVMKRVTFWPQLMLGMTFNWGALLGWSAVQGSCNWSVCLPLYTAGICWTLLYDTIYAHQDKIYDAIVGIKSTALKFGDKTKIYLTGFGTTMIASLITSGIIVSQTWPYYTAVGLVSVHLVNQIHSLNINNPTDCAKKFISNHRVGMILFAGIVLGNLMKDSTKKTEDNVEQEQETEQIRSR
ncbi:ubiquinone biosynthesis protein COQ2, mitochondrial [Megalopta genalis]|uniref:ubiquinone biosynthesis protein COQ2, mitochondrial n=1 Tax=Megalopta genalis TaxID=115081 RepID=UPI003FD4D0AA